MLSQPVSAAAFAAVLSATAANAANIEITNVGFIGDTTDISGFVNETGADTGIILLTTTGGTIIPVFCILVDIGVSDYLHGTGNADIYAGMQARSGNSSTTRTATPCRSPTIRRWTA